MIRLVSNEFVANYVIFEKNFEASIVSIRVIIVVEETCLLLNLLKNSFPVKS